MTDDLDTKRKAAAAWFETLRDRICTTFEGLEDDHSGMNSDRPPNSGDVYGWSSPLSYSAW